MRSLEYLIKGGIGGGIVEILAGNLEEDLKIEMILLIQDLSKQKIFLEENLKNVFEGLLGVVKGDGENYEQIFANFLVSCNVGVAKLYVKALLSHKSESIILCLLNSFQRAFIKQEFFEFIMNCKMEKQLIQCFFKVSVENYSPTACKAVLINAVKLTLLPSLSNTDEAEFSFTHLVEKLRDSKILLQTLESDLNDCVLNSMIDKKQEIIRFPQIIPLFSELICQNSASVIGGNKKLLRKLKNSQICIDLLANHHFLSNIFYYLLQRTDFELWKNCEILCMQLISVHFSIYDLGQWLKIFVSCSESEMKSKILSILRTALNKAQSSDQVWKYIYFLRENQVFFDYIGENFVLGKEFGIVCWVLGDNRDNNNFSNRSVILALKLTFDVVEIGVANQSVQVKISEICIEAPNSLKKNSWNCVYVTVGPSLSVWVNGVLQMTKSRKNYKIPKVNKLEKVCICNSCIFTTENYGFEGKVSSLLLFKKALDPVQIQELFNISPNISCIDIDKEFKDLVFLDLLDNLHESTITFPSIYKFHNIPIHKTLKAYGIRRFLLQVHKSITDPETLNEFFSLAKTLIYRNLQKFETEYFSKDSIWFLSYLLTKSSYSDDICCSIENILEICSDENGKTIINTLITSKHLLMFLLKNKKLYRFVFKKLKILLELNKENLLIICNTIKTVGFEDFSEDLTGYLNGKPETEIFQFFPQVLFHFALNQEYDTIHKILISLKILEIDVNTCKNMLGAILYIVDKQFPCNLQILAVDLIFFNPQKVPNKENFKQVFEFIDKSLPLSLSFELIQYFLFIGFDVCSLLKEFRFHFLDIIVKRLGFVNDLTNFELIFKTFEENSEFLFEGIVKREAFCSVFADCLCENNEWCIKIAELLIEQAAGNGAFWFIREFFSVNKNLGLFKRILTNLKADCKINEVLQSFEVLKPRLEQDPTIYLGIFHTLESSETIINLAKVSIHTFSFPKQEMVSRASPALKDFITNYLNFLLSGLVFFRSLSEPFDFFHNFLSLSEISYLNKGSLEDNTDLQYIEAFLSIFILTELFNYYASGHYLLKEDIIQFIILSKISLKLLKFCEKQSFIQNSIYDLICTESLIEINRDNIEYKVQARQKAFKDCQNKLSDSLCCSDLTNSEIFLNTEKLSEIVSVFKGLFKQLSINSHNFERFTENFSSFKTSTVQNKELLEKWLDEIRDITWVQISIESSQRFLSKITQDYKTFKKSQKKLAHITKNSSLKTIKIRKNYDKLGRWSTLKCDYPKSLKFKSKKIDLIAKSLQIPQKELYIQTDSNTESPNISDNSTFASRENTGNYSVQKYSNLNIYTTYIERIKIEGSFFGKLKINSEFFELIFEGNYKDPDFPGALQFTFAAATKTRIWYPNEFSEILLKRFIHKHTAIEFVLKSGKSYFINFFTSAKREEVVKILETWNLKTKIRIFKKDLNQLINDWKKGSLSNFEYLMLVNKYASRSLNDLSQYPVFPWVAKNYDVKQLDYEDLNMFRNLKFPIGAQEYEQHKVLQIKYEGWKEELLKPYHHGSHYSNPGIVLHYLIRIEPYLTQAKLLQGGDIDMADRLFSSINNAWISCVENIGTDVKELTPELYFNVWVLKNFGNINLGVTSDGFKVNNVLIPNWANCEWDFIIKHRNLLESQIVSKELNAWIDLIFGFRQNGEAGESFFNIFCSASYENMYEDFCNTHDQLDGGPMTEQVYHFGQSPQVLFREKGHPVRDNIGKIFTIYKYFYKNSSRDLKFVPKDKNIGVFGKVHSLFIASDFLYIVKTVNKETFICKFGIKDNEIGNFVSEHVLQGFQAIREGEFSYINSKFQEKSVKLVYGCKNFALISNKFLVAGLDVTNRVKIFDLKGKLFQCLSFHTQFITSVAAVSEQIFSGSFDSSIKAWRLDKENFFSSLSFYGHDSPIFLLNYLDTFQILVSVSANQTILLHDTKNSECLYRIQASVISIDTNEHGLIGVVFENKVQYFGVNGEIAAEYEVQEKVQFLKITPCGNFSIEISEGSLLIRDIFRSEKIERLEIIGTMKIDQIALHPSEEAIFYVKKQGLEAFIGSYKLVSDKIEKGQRDIIFDIV